jgi:chaperonin GroES
LTKGEGVIIFSATNWNPKKFLLYQGDQNKEKQGRKEEGHTMKIIPLQDRVLVKRLEEEEKTKGGIIIPDTAKEKPIEGKVVAAGKGRVKEDGTVIPLEVKAGDKVLFSKYAGTEIKLDGEEHLIMREDDILGIIKD